MLVSIFAWLNDVSLPLLGLLLLASMAISSASGLAIRRWYDRRRTRNAKVAKSDSQEGYAVSAVLGLLALLLGFTFSIALDRFDARRHLVLEDANAIGTAYLRTQLLGQPHRARLSNLLVEYTDNMIALANGGPKKAPPLLAIDDRLLSDIWAATAAGFDSIKGLDFSDTFVTSMNNMIELDASRRAARQAHVPPQVCAVLLVYMVVTAAALGFVLTSTLGRLVVFLLLGLFTISFLLIIDIDRPTSGGILESQSPMEQLRASLKSQPISVYDRWREPQIQR